MTTSKTTRRDLIIALLMLLAAGLLYWYLQRRFFVERMKVKGATFSENLTEDVTHVNLSGPQFHDQDLKFLATISTLKVLNLEGSSISKQGLSYLRRCQNLENLNLTGTQLTDEGIRHVSKIPNLRFLFLTDTAVTDKGLQHLSSASKLVQLDLDDCEQISVSGLESLARLPMLKELYIRSVPLTFNEYLALQNKLPQVWLVAEATSLLGLEASDPLSAFLYGHTGTMGLMTRKAKRGLIPSGTVITKDLLEQTPNKEIIVSFSNDKELPITEEAILALRNFPNLKSLSLTNHTLPQTFQIVANFPKLHSLSLHSLAKPSPDSQSFVISYADISELARLKDLQSLTITLPNANPKAFSALRALPELRLLSLYNNRLTDADILFLRDLKKLERISLRENQLTDASLDTLMDLPKLTYVDLGENPISRERAQEFSLTLRKRVTESVAD